jgi:hypothetical protein
MMFRGLEWQFGLTNLGEYVLNYICGNEGFFNPV